jgi:hypothetical protein
VLVFSVTRVFVPFGDIAAFSAVAGGGRDRRHAADHRLVPALAVLATTVESQPRARGERAMPGAIAAWGLLPARCPA